MATPMKAARLDELETEMMMHQEAMTEAEAEALRKRRRRKREKGQKGENENESELAPHGSSSTRLFEKIERNKFNGSRRCVILTAAIVAVTLLNLVAAAVATVRGDFDVLLTGILWLTGLTSLIVALVFVVNTEASSLNQHNTYGFARAEVVGAVIVCTFLAGVTMEGLMDCIELLFHELGGISNDTELECPKALSHDSYVFKLSYFGLDCLLRCLFILLITVCVVRNHSGSTPFPNDSSEDLVKWRSSNDTLLLNAFVLNLITGLAYDAMQVFVVIANSQTPSNAKDSGDSISGILSAASNSSSTTTTTSCAAWMPIVERLSFPISHMLVFPFLVWLLRRSCLIVLQTVPPKFNAIQLKEKLLHEVEGLTSVHEFHLWQLNANKIIVTLHVSCSREHSQDEYEKLRDEITRFFHKEGIHSITVQPEFVDPEESPSDSSCQFDCKEEWPGPSCYRLQCCLEEQKQQQQQSPHTHRQHGQHPASSRVHTADYTL